MHNNLNLIFLISVLEHHIISQTEKKLQRKKLIQGKKHLVVVSLGSTRISKVVMCAAMQSLDPYNFIVRFYSFCELYDIKLPPKCLLFK